MARNDSTTWQVERSRAATASSPRTSRRSCRRSARGGYCAVEPRGIPAAAAGSGTRRTSRRRTLE